MQTLRTRGEVGFEPLTRETRCTLYHFVIFLPFVTHLYMEIKVNFLCVCEREISQLSDKMSIEVRSDRTRDR